MSHSAEGAEPRDCNSIKKGGFIVMKQKFPCKVTAVSVSKTGKHGHAKMKIVASDIFTGNKHQDVVPTSHKVLVPLVSRTDYKFLAIDDQNFVDLLDGDETLRQDLQVTDEELIAKLKTAEQESDSLVVTVLAAMGTEKIIAVKSGKEEG
eukprot:TRINITY_DN14664_c0_g1_i1.p1 TRINITY_DN14664_c0_g1~~TRINITY_DN14664_c0_g1_i1.p1  ORF type:complete len:150 (-),score=28.27 TRINITY_DN14664_c0_g1_i1:53-502(-)